MHIKRVGCFDKWTFFLPQQNPQMINMFFVGLLSSKNQLLKNKSLDELDIQVRS